MSLLDVLDELCLLMQENLYLQLCIDVLQVVTSLKKLVFQQQLVKGVRLCCEESWHLAVVFYNKVPQLHAKTSKPYQLSLKIDKPVNLLTFLKF